MRFSVLAPDSFIRPLLLVMAILLIHTGCDSSTGIDPGELGDPVVIEGRATDAGGYGEDADAIEGATVTAAGIRSNGSLHAYEVETQTNAAGGYSLEIEPISDMALLSASGADYSARGLVRLDDGARIQAMPLTVESTVEADVYVDALEAGDRHVNAASVAAYINTALAGQVQSGSTSPSELARVIADAIEAQNRYVTQNDYDDSDITARQNVEADAMIALQNRLHGASSASAEMAAINSLYEEMVEAWNAAGIDFLTQAKARGTGVGAVAVLTGGVSSATRTELRRQMLRLFAISTGLAIEAEFEGGDASADVLSDLADARADYVSGIAAATSTNQMADAADAYQARVRAALASTLDLTEGQITSAFSAIGTAAAAFNAALQAASSANAVASAYVSYDDAATTALNVYFDEIETAHFAANVILILTL